VLDAAIVERRGVVRAASRPDLTRSGGGRPHQHRGSGGDPQFIDQIVVVVIGRG